MIKPEVEETGRERERGSSGSATNLLLCDFLIHILCVCVCVFKSMLLLIRSANIGAERNSTLEIDDVCCRWNAFDLSIYWYWHSSRVNSSLMVFHISVIVETIVPPFSHSLSLSLSICVVSCHSGFVLISSKRAILNLLLFSLLLCALIVFPLHELFVHLYLYI